MDFAFILNFILQLGKAVIGLFIIVDPFGNIPIFVGLTENVPDAQRKKIYNTAIIVGMILLLVFAFTGQGILSLFGVSLPSFYIAGGILLLIVSIRILITGSMHENFDSIESLGAVPIAIPLLVGPGAITTTILDLQIYDITITVLAVVLVLALTWIILRYINQIYKLLGKTGSLVIARVMALLIAAIAVQYILTGVTHFGNFTGVAHFIIL